MEAKQMWRDGPRGLSPLTAALLQLARQVPRTFASVASPKIAASSRSLCSPAPTNSPALPIQTGPCPR